MVDNRIGAGDVRVRTHVVRVSLYGNNFLIERRDWVTGVSSELRRKA